MLVLAKLGLGEWLTAVVLFLVCLLLMLVVMLQKGRGGGLTAAFGGGGGGGGAFGAKTGDVFTWITVVLASVFLLLTVVGNYMFHPQAVAGPAVIRAPGAGVPVSQPPVSQTQGPQSQGPQSQARPSQGSQPPVSQPPGQQAVTPGAGDGAKTTITIPGATAKPDSADTGDESNAGADDGGAAQDDAADAASDEPSDSDDGSDGG